MLRCNGLIPSAEDFPRFATTVLPCPSVRGRQSGSKRRDRELLVCTREARAAPEYLQEPQSLVAPKDNSCEPDLVMQSDLYVYELLHVRNQKPTCNLDIYMHRLNISFVEIRVMSAEGPQHQVVYF